MEASRGKQHTLANDNLGRLALGSLADDPGVPVQLRRQALALLRMLDRMAAKPDPSGVARSAEQ